MRNCIYNTFILICIFSSVSISGVSHLEFKNNLKQILLHLFSLNWPIGPIRSTSCDVRPCVSVRVCPLPMPFFCVRGLVHASLVRGLVHASVALAWSPKNGEVFRIGRITRRNVGM